MGGISCKKPWQFYINQNKNNKNYFWAFFTEARGLTLNEVQVPHMVVIDDENTEPIKLDCLYELNEDPTYLVVKWFIDDKGIYQWIRGQQPSVFVWFF